MVWLFPGGNVIEVLTTNKQHQSAGREMLSNNLSSRPTLN